MRSNRIPQPSSLQWLSKQHPGTLAAIILNECINFQQLRLKSFDTLSRSLVSFAETEATSWWTGMLDAAATVDIRLFQLASRFEGRWNIHKIPRPTQTGKPTPLDYYQDIQAARVWNQQRSTRTALHEFLLEIYEKIHILHRVSDRNVLLRLRRRSIEIIASLSSEVCASIPFHLRKLNEKGKKCSSDTQQVAGACGLIWPLETIAKSRYNSEDHRLLARATLAEVDHAMGIRQVTRTLTGLSDRESSSLAVRGQEESSFPCLPYLHNSC